MATIAELLRVQIGTESTRGTPVTPTAELALSDAPSVKPTHDAESFSQLGNLSPAVAARVMKIGVGATVSGKASYEQMPYFLDALLGEATPSGAGPYTYTYTAPVSAQPTPRILTLVYGDAGGAYQASGLVGQRLSLETDGAGAVQFSTDMLGVSASAATLADLNPPSVEPIMGHQATLYIDPWTGTPGSTAVNAVQFSVSLSVDGQTDNIYGMSQAPVGYRYGRFDGGLRMSLELGPDARALIDDLLGTTGEPTKRLIRVAFTGAGGNALEIDFAGVLMAAPELYSDNEGVVTVDFEWAPLYHDALGTWLQIAVTNNLPALP